MCDAVCGALYNASSHAEEYAFDYGENIDAAVDVSMGGNPDYDRKQISVDFEEALKQIKDPLGLKSDEKREEIKRQTETFLDFGMGSAQDISDLMSVADGLLF